MFPVQSGQRKSGPLVPYQLHCTKAPLNDEYGPPDYFPVQPGCVEAQLGAQVLQWGFKDSQAALGITEAQEVSLSFGKLWTPANAEKARQSVWHHLRSIQSQQDAKRKASEAFGQPLPHDQPTLGRGSVPELRQVSDEARQQWLQSLASSVPLCQMAGDVPNGLYKGPLFDALYQHRVATSRACWLIKIVYVNRIRPDKAAGGNACVNQRSVAYSQHLRDHLESCMVPLLTQQAVKPAGQNVAGSAGSEAASKWQYMLRISGASYREGLICLQTLADWLLRSLLAALQATATGAARISSLLPLLQLCLRELALSQQLVRRTVELCLKALQPSLAASPHQPSFARILHMLLLLVPQTFIALDVFPSASRPSSAAAASGAQPMGIDDKPISLLDTFTVNTPNQQAASNTGGLLVSLGPDQDQAGSDPLRHMHPTRLNCRGSFDAEDGLTAAAEQVACQVQRMAAELRTDVQARVLAYTDADAMAVIQDGLAVGSSPATLEALSGLVAKGVPPTQTTQETVRLVCDWAASLPAAALFASSSASVSGPAVLEQATQQSVRRLWAGCLLRALEHQLSIGQHGSMGMAQGSKAPVGSPPALQSAIFTWLDTRSPPAAAGEERQALSLLLYLVEDSLFCPATYLRLLVARGVVQPCVGTRAEALKRAHAHRRYLRHLHPQLHLPTLQAPTVTPAQSHSASKAASGTPLVQQPGHEAGLGHGSGSGQDQAAVLDQGSPGRPAAASQQWTPARLLYAEERRAVLSMFPSHLEPDGDQLHSLDEERRQSSRSASTAAAASPADPSPSPSPSPAPNPDANAQKRLRAVQQLVAQSLGWVTNGAPADPDDRALLRHIVSLRTWEQCCLARWLATEAHTLGPTAQRLGTCSSSPTWWLRVLAFLDAAGGPGHAVQLLLSLATNLQRSHSSVPTQSAATPPSEAASAGGAACPLAGVEPCVLASLAARRQVVVAMGAAAAARNALSGLDFADSVLDLQWLAENGAGSPPSVAEVITSAPPARLVAEAQQLCTSLQDAPSTDVNRPVSQAVASALTSWVTDPAAKPDPAPQSADPQLEAASQDLRLEAAVQAVTNSMSGSLQLDAVLQCLAALGACLRQAGLAQAPSRVQRAVLGACWRLSHKAPPDQQASLPSVANMLMGTIAAGLVMLPAAMHALLPPASSATDKQFATWAGLLLGAAADSAGPAPEVGIGVAAAVAHSLRSMPVKALTAAALPVLQDACSGSAGSAALVAAAQLCANPTLTATLLSRPQALYKQLLQGPHQQPGIPASQCTALPARLTVASLLQGQLQPRKDVAAGLAANQAFVARLLDTLTPAVCGPYWLALRTALDEQIMLAALQRGSSAEEARARARSAFQEAQQGKLAEQDKAFTSQVLAQLLVRPQAAPSYSKLAWQLGRGVGEYLLQQVDWILLDPDTLLGHKTLAQALQRRCLVDVQSDAGLVALDHPGSEPAPFAVEAALSQVALSGLAASQAVRQREFAEHVVNQLQRLADILKQHAADSMGGKPAGTRQVSQPPAAASTAGEVGTPGSPPDPKRRRSTGSFGAFGSFGKRKFGAAADITALTPGTAAGVRVAVWLRLAVLLPLLPLVYADREADDAKNLRAILLRSILRLCASPLIHSNSAAAGVSDKAAPGTSATEPAPAAGAAAAAAAAAAGTGNNEGVKLGGGVPASCAAMPASGTNAAPGAGGGDVALNAGLQGRLNEDPAKVQAAVAAAEARAGEPLSQRLLSIFQGLIAGSWPAWLRGEQGARLREIGVYENSAALQAELDGLQLLARLKLRLQAALPDLPCPAIHIPPASPGPWQEQSGAPRERTGLSDLSGSLPGQADGQDGQTSQPNASVDASVAEHEKQGWVVDPWLLLESRPWHPHADCGASEASNADITAHEGSNASGSATAGAEGDCAAPGNGASGASSRTCFWLAGAVRLKKRRLRYAPSDRMDWQSPADQPVTCLR